MLFVCNECLWCEVNVCKVKSVCYAPLGHGWSSWNAASQVCPGMWSECLQSEVCLLYTPGAMIGAVETLPAKSLSRDVKWMFAKWSFCSLCTPGAMVGALETLPAKSLSRDAYLQHGRLPDWCCLDQDTWADDRTVQRRWLETWVDDLTVQQCWQESGLTTAWYNNADRNLDWQPHGTTMMTGHLRWWRHSCNDFDSSCSSAWLTTLFSPCPWT